MSAPFQRVGIVGVGLIGGSVALATRRAHPATHLVGLDTGRELDLAHVVDRRARSLGELADADLILVSVPVADLARTLGALAEAAPAALVTDVCSTKRTAMAEARKAGLKAFIGGHPMAGSERAGLESARPDLFDKRPWLLVRGSAGLDHEERLKTFVASLGAAPHWLEADEHDRTVAYVSHLPQMLAAALMNTGEAGVPATGPIAAGRAFREMTRLASSPSAMWTSVLADNADFVREALEAFLRQLPDAASAPGDWVREALASSGQARERWCASDPPTE